jgi:acyl-CoA thioesterase
MDTEEVKQLIEHRDRLISQFQMHILELKAGYAVVRMKVTEEHLNAAGSCHGGVIFSLADVSFALACNSHGTLALALDMSISFLRSVLPGSEITACCSERYRGKRTGSYTIEVTDNSHNLVALLKATAFRKDTPLSHIS